MQTTVEQAYQACQELTRREAKNFYYAFITLPRAKRRAIYAVYSFCRLADDSVDEPVSLEEKLERLSALRAELDSTLAGRPRGPVFTALADAVESFSIPPAHLHEILKGVEMDLTRHRYATFADLERYCYHVAGAVGLVSLHIFGFRRPEARDRAVELGLAMQLANIIRDVREDAERGRIYIPLEDLERFGYSEDQLMGGVVNDEFRRMMAFEVERTREFFHRGFRLLPLLDARSRACPAVLGSLYRRLLDRIESRGYDVFSGRARLSTGEKLLITLTVWLRSLVLPLAPR